MRWSARESGVPYVIIAFFWLAWIGVPALLMLAWMGLLPEGW